MAIDFEVGLLADHAHLDASGKLYVLGEFRYIMAKEVPATHTHLSVFARWTAPKGEIKTKPSLQIEVVDSDGGTILPRSPELPLNFTPIGPSARGRGRVQAQVIVQMNALPVPHFGDFAITFFINGKPNGSVPYYVGKLRPADDGE